MLAFKSASPIVQSRASVVHTARLTRLALLFTGAMLCFAWPAVSHSQEGMLPGEAYVTTFSGAATVPEAEGPRTAIDLAGVVGTAIDLSVPGFVADGRQWPAVPRRFLVTAGDVGQVFNIAFDDADPPNVYLAATSAFGLHRTSDNSEWMEGMWGPNGGGPGTIWKLNGLNDYRPELFADVTLEGRHNSGAALGGLAYDRQHRQLFVADLETGTIHRLTVADGTDLGHFDHGREGRVQFIDATSGNAFSLPAVAFRPETEALISTCPFGAFENTPTCWNFADFRRRVYGLAVRIDEASGRSRLYYSVWSSQGFGNPAWIGAGEEQKNSVWSIGLTADGDFDRTDVRREFLLPDMFTDPVELARNGPSEPVAGMAFPACGESDTLVLAERAGRRNLALDQDNSFAAPQQARVLRYRLDPTGAWRLEGPLDIGFLQRTQPPPDRANAAGGVTFGYGYDTSGRINLQARDGTLWASGDYLCSPKDRASTRVKALTATNRRCTASKVCLLTQRPARSRPDPIRRSSPAIPT